MKSRAGEFTLLLAAFCVALATATGSAAEEPVLHADDRFLERLIAGTSDEPVDRARLAEMFLNVARELEGEHPKIEALQHGVRVPEAVRDNVRLMLESRSEEHGENVRAFLSQASALVAQPNSRIRLYRTLSAGQRTCWTLDLYNQLVGAWIAGGPEMRSLYPSRIACGRFRTAAFQPRVEALIEEALVEQVFQREEIGRLEQDLSDLQTLIDDLIQIDGAE